MTAATHVLIPDQLYGIIGHPLGHSLSPLLHNWGFQHHGLQAVYFQWPTPPASLPEFVTAIRTLPIAGVSVTIPHKQSVMPYLDELSADAVHAGAVNTLFWAEGKLWGENTDVHGFLAPLRCRPEPVRDALVLGVGGAARAAVRGLKLLGVETVLISGRNPEATRSLATSAECGWMDWEQRSQWSGDLLVNATPLGMSGQFERLSPWPGKTTGIRLAYDLVYNPQKTCFLQAAASSGTEIILGLEMFLAQAQEQFRIWTKKELPADDCRELLLAKMGVS